MLAAVGYFELAPSEAFASAEAYARVDDNDEEPFLVEDGPYSAPDEGEESASDNQSSDAELGDGFGYGIAKAESRILPSSVAPTVSMVTQELTTASGNGYLVEEGPPYWAWSRGAASAHTWATLSASFEYVDTTPEIEEEFYAGLSLVGTGGGVAEAVATTNWGQYSSMCINVWRNAVLIASISATGGGSGGFNVEGGSPGGPVVGDPGTTEWCVSGFAGEVQIDECSTQLNVFIAVTTEINHGDTITFEGCIESWQSSDAVRWTPGEGSALAQAVFGEAINAFGFAYPVGEPPTPPTPDPTPSPLPSPGPPSFGPPAPGDLDDDGDIDGDDAIVWASDPSILMVTTENDESDGDYSFFDLSLREALLLAGDVGHPGEDTIVFAPWVHHIDLDMGQLTIASNVDIVGPGLDQLTIDGLGTTRVFQIPSGAVVEIHDLTVHDGYTSGSGGAIYNQGNLTLDGVTVQESRADAGGGIYNYYGTLNVLNSRITNNLANYGGGGGIYTTGPNSTIITSSTIDNNTGYYGGGVRVDMGIMIMTNSTVSSNLGYDGGGIAVTGTYSSYSAIYHSTIAFNSAVSGRGLFISTYPYPTYVTLRHSIVASNGSGAQISGPLGSNSDNLIAASAGLLPLDENGGPTRTHALASNSAAIDAGNPSAVAGAGGIPLYDQRGEGFARIIDGNGVPGARIDIGAYEYDPAAGGGSAAGTLVASSEISSPIGTQFGDLSLFALTAPTWSEGRVVDRRTDQLGIVANEKYRALLLAAETMTRSPSGANESIPLAKPPRISAQTIDLAFAQLTDIRPALDLWE